MTWVEGADYSYSHPDPHGFKAAGKLFALRYLSHTAGKGLTTAERDALWAAGVAIGGLYESTADRALAGHGAGVADATLARQIGAILGYPADKPVIYAVDFNATTAQLNGPVGDYLRGVASVDPHAGVYGGLHTIGWTFDHNVMPWGFQTYAWSAGAWDPRAQIQQYHNGVTVAGGVVDLCRGLATYPFWTDPGSGDVPIGGDEPMTPADAQLVVDTLLQPANVGKLWDALFNSAAGDKIPLGDQPAGTTDPALSSAMKFALYNIQRAVNLGTQDPLSLKAALDDLAAAVAKIPTTPPAAGAPPADATFTGTVHFDTGASGG